MTSTTSQACLVLGTHFIIQQTAKDEDEQSLQGIEYGEHVGSVHVRMGQVEDAKGPGQA